MTKSAPASRPVANAPASIGPIVNTEVLLDSLLSAPAGTYAITGQPYRGDGIIVALPRGGRVLEPWSTPSTSDVYRHMTEWITDRAAPLILDAPAPFSRPRYLGVWISDGTVYLDVVEVFAREDRDEAIKVGVIRNQISIWDAGRGEEIATGGNGRI